MMNQVWLREMVKQALIEDIGFGDRTTEAIIPIYEQTIGHWLAQQHGIVSGFAVVHEVFAQLDGHVQFSPLIEDGQPIYPGQKIAEIKGSTRSILSGERVALNYLQRLSGISTLTAQAVKEVEGYDCHIVDTRKTTPGLRMLEKYAVQMGGGRNHRLRLDDAVLIKDNHIAAAGSITEAVRRARLSVGHLTMIEVEAETLAQVQEAVQASADAILFDNMTIDQIREAMRLLPQHIITEVSGGLKPGKLKEFAALGVHVLSLGWLTHSAQAMNIRLNVDNVLKNEQVSSHEQENKGEVHNGG